MLIARDMARSLDPVVLAADCGVICDDWQADFLRNPSRRVLLLAARQTGKTETCVLHSLHVAHTEPESLILVLSPAQRLSNEFIRRAKLYYNRLEGVPAIKNDNVQRIELENGARILALPGDNDGDTVRGLANVRLILVDEASRVSDALVVAVRPMLAVNKNGALIALTTPNGKRGFFYENWIANDSDWQRIKVTTDMCPRLTREFLESERKALGDTAFESEYGLVFHDNEIQYFNSDLIQAALDPTVKPLWKTCH